MRITPVRDIDDILNSCAVRRGDHPESGNILRQRFFVLVVEQALFEELFLELFKTLIELAYALLFYAVGVELILAVTLINAYLAGDDHAHALGHVELQAGDPFSCEHHAGYLPALVLQSKVNMP